MREQDMRRRIEGFLRNRLRGAIAPAALGLGLALGGCNGDAVSDDGDGGPDAQGMVREDAATPTVKYMAQLPDAGPELPLAQPEYMAPMQDSGPFVRYGSPSTSDAGRDLGMVALYMAQQPTGRS
jgi:hypothetical protein